MSCDSCLLKNSSRVPNTVIKSKLAVVGESPYREEVKQGRVFAGESGAVLNRALEYVKINREKIAILNSFQCMINQNGKTSATLKTICKECRNNLVEDLKQVQPEVIIALGEVALYQLTKLSGISKHVGRVIESEEFKCRIIPCYHPSHLLRQGGGDFKKMSFAEQAFLQCFILAKKILTGKDTAIATSGYRLGTEKDIEELLKSEVVAFDAEYPDGKFLCGGFSNKEGVAYVFYPDEVGIRAFREILQNPKIAKVVASRPADEHIMEKEFGIKFAGRIYDVLTMAHVLDENMPKYSLEAVANMYTPLKNIKDTAEGMRFELNKADRDLQIRYNGTDCDATLRSYKAMKAIYRKNPSLALYYGKFIMPVQKALGDMMRVGVPVSIEKLKSVEEELNKHLVWNKIEALRCIPKSIKEKHKDNLSLSKPALIVDYLFTHEDGLKLTPQRFTPTTKQPSTDEDHLKMFYNRKFVKHLLEWKKIYKIINTYISNIYKYYIDGKIYPSISLTSTVTGRTSMARPSMQNFPKRGIYASLIRSVIKAPEGYTLIEGDLAQSELRIAGWIANDPNILDALYKGIDLHKKTASIVTGKPIEKVTKDERDKAKAVNFGYLYGQSAEGFVEYARSEYGIEFKLDQAREIRDKFFSYPNGYYRLLNYQEETIRFARKYGWVEQPLGRRRRLPTITSSDDFIRGKAERQAINFRIQAFSSDLALIGLMLFNDRYENDPNTNVVLFIHDAIIAMCRDEDSELVAKTLKLCMEDLSVSYIKSNFNIVVGYPVVAEIKAGKSLDRMEVIL